MRLITINHLTALVLVNDNNPVLDISRSVVALICVSSGDGRREEHHHQRKSLGGGLHSNRLRRGQPHHHRGQRSGDVVLQSQQPAEDGQQLLPAKLGLR